MLLSGISLLCRSSLGGLSLITVFIKGLLVAAANAAVWANRCRRGPCEDVVVLGLHTLRFQCVGLHDEAFKNESIVSEYEFR
jgi:hypothetical protein